MASVNIKSDKIFIQERRIQTLRNLMIKYKYAITTIWLVFSVVLVIIGAVLLNRGTIIVKFEETEREIIYSKCKYFNYNTDVDNITCQQYFESNPFKSFDCVCDMTIDVMLRGNVTLYFELPGYDQSSPEYINSKDDEQLRGILSESPSAQCEPYRFDNGRPIAPCGAIADSMLLDEVTSFKTIVNQSSVADVRLLRNGMLSGEQKAGYSNPPNLTYALQNFSKPTNWTKHIYELDLDNEENNGFQNEFFISWMKTYWKRKPFARLDQIDPVFQDGLPNGTYQFNIKFHPSPLGYPGERRLIFVGKDPVEETVPCSAGGILLGFGLVMLVAGLLYLGYPSLRKLYSDKVRHAEEQKMRQNVDETNALSRNEQNNASFPLSKDRGRAN